MKADGQIHKTDTLFYNFLRIDSSPASIVSTDVEKLNRTYPSPASPNTEPGTVATWADSNNLAAAVLLLALMRVTSGNA